MPRQIIRIKQLTSFKRCDTFKKAVQAQLSVIFYQYGERKTSSDFENGFIVRAEMAEATLTQMTQLAVQQEQ